MHQPCAALLLVAISVLTSVARTHAQTPLSGQIYDGSGGPLRSGVVYHATGSPTVPVGRTLTIEPGAIVKLDRTTLQVRGSLLAEGTPGAPIVFTSLHDDTAGGDTNGNGSSTSPVPQQWGGIALSNGVQPAVLRHVEVRFSGRDFWPALSLYDSTALLQRCLVRDCGYGGLRLERESRPRVEDCVFERVAVRPAIDNVPYAALAGFAFNTARACSGGNYLSIGDYQVSSPVVLEARQAPNGVFVSFYRIEVLLGGSLIFGEGVVLKLRWPERIDVWGQLGSRGNAVLTTLTDDAFGGDTNGDGAATTPAPGAWIGVRYQAGSTGSLHGARVRFAGATGSAGIECASPAVDLRGCRVERGAAAGFLLQDVAAARDLVAFDNAGDGVQLAGGNFELTRTTAARNGAFGVVRTGRWEGRIASSIASANSIAGFWGIPADRIHYSNGLGIAGGTGNLLADPRFRDLASGDLGLESSSPCIDAGDPADAASGLDALGFPRRQDGDLDGEKRVDMGAGEFSGLRLALQGDLRTGGSVTMSSAADPRMLAAVLVFGVGPAFELDLGSLGALFPNVANGYLLLDWAPNASASFPLPAELPATVDLVIQGLGFAATPGFGHTSNPLFATLH